MSDEAKRYVYGFVCWPDHTTGWSKAMFTLFERFQSPRQELEFTSAGFHEFRQQLLADGITLREIDRVPAFVSEVVL